MQAESVVPSCLSYRQVQTGTLYKRTRCRPFMHHILLSLQALSLSHLLILENMYPSMVMKQGSFIPFRPSLPRSLQRSLKSFTFTPTGNSRQRIDESYESSHSFSSSHQFRHRSSHSSTRFLTFHSLTSPFLLYPFDPPLVRGADWLAGDEKIITIGPMSALV